MRPYLPSFGFQKQAGNALFLILIAVALFAALSYAVTQSGRGGGSISKEQAALKAARLSQFGGEIQAAVQKLQLLNGCTADQIDFGTGYNVPSYSHNPPVNPARRADGSCDVFGANGGNVPVMAFDSSYCRTGIASCAVTFMRAPILGVGTTTGQETFLWGYHIHPDICRAINKSLGISTSLPSTFWVISDIDGAQYLDLVGGGSSIGDAPSPVFTGQADGCYCYGGANGECNPYFTVIIR